MNLFEILAKWPGIYHEAETAYNNMTNNHPTIHTNRFPGWGELHQDQQEEWVRKVAADKIQQK